MKTRMTIKQQIIKAVDMSNKKKHTEDCIDANDDTSVFQGECICPKSHHTPGPWKAERGAYQVRDPQFWQTPVIHGGLRVANVAATSKGESEANARLIAAAPDLLEALKAVSRNPTQYDKWMPAVIDAIHRAEGK